MKKANNHLVITILAKKSFQQLKLSILKRKKKQILANNVLEV
jgi:hypothetical protein